MQFINLTGREVLPRTKSKGYKSLEVLVSNADQAKFVIEDEVIKVVPENHQGGTLFHELMDGLEEDAIWVATDKVGFINYLKSEVRYFFCDDVFIISLKSGRLSIPIDGKDVFLDINTNTARDTYTLIGVEQFGGKSSRDELAYDKVYDGTLKVNIWARDSGDTTFTPSEDFGISVIDNGWQEDQRQKAEAEAAEKQRKEEERKARLEAERAQEEEKRRSQQAASFLELVSGL